MLIHEKMIKIMSEVTAIGKNEHNDKQGFSFRGIDTVYNELHNLFSKNGVYAVPDILSERSEQIQTKQGSILIYRIITVKYTFYCSDGSSVTSTVVGEGMDSGDKASRKAMSAAHKTSLLQVFMIPTDEKKDADYDSYELSSKKIIVQPTKLELKKQAIDLFQKVVEPTESLRVWIAQLDAHPESEILSGIKGLKKLTEGK